MAKTSPSEIIMVFVVIIIGASLVPVVGTTIFASTYRMVGHVWANATTCNACNQSQELGNVTGASLAILSLLTLFFVIVVIMIAVKKIRA